MGGPEHAHCRGGVSPTGRVPGQSPTEARPPARVAPGRCSLFRKDLRCSRDSSLPVGMGSPLACWATAHAPESTRHVSGLLEQRGAGPDHLQGRPAQLVQPSTPRADGLTVLQTPCPRPRSSPAIRQREGPHEGSRQDPQGTLASGPLAGHEAAPRVLVGWMGERGGNRAHLRPRSVPCKVRLGNGAAHPPWTWSVQRSVK